MRIRFRIPNTDNGMSVPSSKLAPPPPLSQPQASVSPLPGTKGGGNTRLWVSGRGSQFERL
jgi:hypothetical protein